MMDNKDVGRVKQRSCLGVDDAAGDQKAVEVDWDGRVAREPPAVGSSASQVEVIRAAVSRRQPQVAVKAQPNVWREAQERGARRRRRQADVINAHVFRHSFYHIMSTQDPGIPSLPPGMYDASLN